MLFRSDPKGNIRKSLVSASTDFYTLNISTLNLVVDGMCNLAKVETAGSSPVVRSTKTSLRRGFFVFVQALPNVVHPTYRGLR